jgi:hypothetical protein
MPNRIETLLGQRRSRKRCGAVPQFIKAPLATLKFDIVKKTAVWDCFFGYGDHSCSTVFRWSEHFAALNAVDAATLGLVDP